MDFFAFGKSILEYGLPGLSLGILYLTIRLHDKYNARLMDLIERNAVAKAELTAAVQDLKEVVQAKLHG